MTASERHSIENLMIFSMFFFAPSYYFAGDASFYDSLRAGVHCFGALVLLKFLYKAMKA
jgi:hypothetical protein